MSEETFAYPRSKLPLIPRIRHKLREPLAEFLGTMVLILFGDGVVAQVVLSAGEKGEYQSISWCWGIGVMFGVYCSGGISGGHLNPAVTLSNCVYRGFPWKKLPAYVLAQMLGAFCGSMIVYGNYKSAIDNFEGQGIRSVLGDTSSAGIFCTYPAEFMTRTGMFFSEIVASAILMMGIYAINDDNNLAAGDLGPIALFFLIFGIGAAFGWETGYAINPARDFGPRFASFCLGYSPQVFSAGGYYFWIPIVGPCLGCLLGGFIYDLLVFTGAESPLNMPYIGLTSYRNDFSDQPTSVEKEEPYRHNPKDLPGLVHGHTDHDILGMSNVIPNDHLMRDRRAATTPPPPPKQTIPTTEHVESV